MANGYLFELPDFETGDDESMAGLVRRLRRIEKHLYTLNEQLRYSLYNLDEDNLTEAYQTRMEQTMGELYAKFEVTAGQIQSTVGELNGTMTQISQTVDSISFDVYDQQGHVASEIALGIGSISLTAEDIRIQGNVTLSDLFQSGTTVISGDHIDTGSISLDDLVINDNTYIYAQGGDLHLYGSSNSSEVYIGNPSGWVYLDGGASIYGRAYIHGQLNMMGENVHNVAQLQAYSGLFDGWCYAPDWTEGSDRRIKHDIQALGEEEMTALAEALEPVRYRLNSDQEDKLRYGFIAQDVQAALQQLGLDEGDSPLYRLAPGRDEMGISYPDLIAPLWAAVQGLLRRVKELEAKLNG